MKNSNSLSVLILALFLILIVSSCANKQKTKVENNGFSSIDQAQPDETLSEETVSGFIEVDSSFLSFSFIVVDSYYLICDAETSWLKGEPQLIPNRGAAAISDVDLSKLPEQYRKMIGKKVRVYDEFRRYDEGEIIDLKIVVDFVPHFGTIQKWNAEFEGEPFTDEEKVADIMEMGQLMLVGVLNTGGGIWCQTADFPEAVAYEAIFVDDSIKDMIKDTIQTFADYMANQTSFEEFQAEGNVPDLNQWTEFESTVEFTAYEIDNELFLFYMVYTEPDICNSIGFEASMFTVWTCRIENQKVELNLFEEYEMPFPDFAYDIDGDKKPDFFVKDDFISGHDVFWSIDDYMNSNGYQLKNMDCPC